MWMRLLALLFTLAAGYLLASWSHLSMVLRLGALGMLGLALLWLALDARRAQQLLRSLHDDTLASTAPRGGLWGEVADRARRLLRLREREAQDCTTRLHDFLQALQASPNGVMLLDQQSHIEWCNQMSAAHFGIDIQRDAMQSVANLVRDPAFVGYLAAHDFGASLTIAGRNSTPSRPVMLSVNLHPYGEGRMMLLSRDITALEQAEAMRRDFVANVSHEIRTPLTVLAGFIETLQTLELDEPERQSYLALMAQQANRMQTLVSDLLTLSRLEGSPAPGLDSQISVPTLMAQLHSDALALSHVMTGDDEVTHQIDVSCDFDGSLCGNPSELLSAMGNLVSNAVRYTPAGGQIRVAMHLRPDGCLVFSVADTGPGIAAEHLGRLTERFYRVDRSRSRETGGTGLGLAIVKHVVQRHGASLSTESKVGQGSLFSITFPAQRVLAQVPSDV